MNLIRYKKLKKLTLENRPPLWLYTKETEWVEIPDDLSDYTNKYLADCFNDTPFVDTDDDIGDNFRVDVGGMFVYCSRRGVMAYTKRLFDTHRNPNVTDENVEQLAINVIKNACKI